MPPESTCSSSPGRRAYVRRLAVLAQLEALRLLAGYVPEGSNDGTAEKWASRVPLSLNEPFVMPFVMGQPSERRPVVGSQRNRQRSANLGRHPGRDILLQNREEREFPALPQRPVRLEVLVDESH